MDELEITPKDVKARLDRGEKVHLVDVREPWEYDLCRIEGAKLVPLGSLAASLQTLPDVDEVICYCHHGMRSLDAAAWLRFRALREPNLWPAESSAGLWRSIRESRGIERVLCSGAACCATTNKETVCQRGKSYFCRSRREPLAAKQEVSCWRWVPNWSHAIWISSD